MMLFKLSCKNIKKCFKDYAVYFLTLIMGVAIFYVFNALDSQEAMMKVTESSREIFKLMITVLSGVSVCVALILGFLIVYANNFLIKRRKKEFAVYMTLGMGKGQISRILLGETVLIGVLSLGVGLAAGVFASQFMSILVAKLFEVDVTAYTFVFSRASLVKTVFCFSLMYLIVVLFNTVAISRYKLIDLFQASGKMEKRRIKSSWLSVFLFMTAVAILWYAYHQVSVNFARMNGQRTYFVIALGCVGTFLVFWSLSGFLLKLLQRCRRFYNSGLNAFVLRQVNSNINTSVFSMTVICLLFFVTICILSTGLALNHAFRNDLKENCPRDIVFYKVMEGEGADAGLTVEEALLKSGMDMGSFQPGYVEVSTYVQDDITYEYSLGTAQEQAEERFPLMRWDTRESIIGISEYNKIAAFYGQSEYTLEEDEYIVLCTVDMMKTLRNVSLKEGKELQIGSHVLQPKYEECKEGYLFMNMQAANLGIIVVPDRVIGEEYGNALHREQNLLAADYVGSSPEEKAVVEERILKLDPAALDVKILSLSKISIYESAVGLSTIAVFIGLYLGVIFLIAGAALLALKELSESTDNRERYAILQKIGADRGMQYRALLAQMGIFFGIPMLLAILHSVFGIRFARNLLSMYSSADELPAMVATGLVLLFVYGAYFMATYFGSRRIIEEK